jgi:hypothetical protein
MKLPNFFKSQPAERHLLVVDYHPDQTRLAYFHDDRGELLFGGNAVGETPSAAYEAMKGKPHHIDECIVGIPFASLIDSSTVVRYRRQHPKSKIDEGEVRGAIERVPPADEKNEPFFEDLFNAKVDGLPTLEPVDRLGDVVELNYYQVYGAKEVVHEIARAVKHLHHRPGIVPTSYAIAKLISQTSPKGALVLDIDRDQTEISLSADGHLVGIKSFDVGGSNPEIFTTAMEATLEDLSYEDLWPEKVYLVGTADNYEKIRSELLAYPWTKKFNMMSFPEVSVFHPLSVNLTLPADVGLNALSLLG